MRCVRKEFSNIGECIAAVDDVTINFYNQEFSVILGHNGSGKSCLLKMIIGMENEFVADFCHSVINEIVICDRNVQTDSRPRLLGERKFNISDWLLSAGKYISTLHDNDTASLYIWHGKYSLLFKI